MKGWFGNDAGMPGKVEKVVFDWKDDKYHLEPLIADISQPHLWESYMRQDIPSLWGLEFKPGSWNQGFVKTDKHAFLLVSLNKEGLIDAHQYQDHFINPETFQWVSQNQHSREGNVGQKLKNHENDGLQVHLFVRARRKTPRGKAAPFIYCGDVIFQDWEGSEPIHIRWKLKKQVPVHLHEQFSIS